MTLSWHDMVMVDGEHIKKLMIQTCLESRSSHQSWSISSFVLLAFHDLTRHIVLRQISASSTMVCTGTQGTRSSLKMMGRVYSPINPVNYHIAIVNPPFSLVGAIKLRWLILSLRCRSLFWEREQHPQRKQGPPGKRGYIPNLW